MAMDEKERLPKEFTMAIGQGEKERFRSFAERYVIERAGHWKPGEEDTGAWAAIKDAKRVYHQIAVAGKHVQEEIGRSIEHAAKTLGALQAGNNAAQQAPTPYSSPEQTALTKTFNDPRTPPHIKQRIKSFLAGGPIF